MKRFVVAGLIAAAALRAPAYAACPAPEPGAALPPEAHAEYRDDKPWRARVAALEQAAPAADLAGTDLLFLGDSITENWDSKIFARHFGGLHPLNWGVRGDTTQGLLWRLARMPLGKTLRPRLIVLMIGTNDTWPGGNPNSAAIGVGEVVRTIRQMAPNSRILLLGILPRGANENDPWRQMAMAMNPLIAACADDRAVFYLDVGSHFVDTSGRVSPAIEADYLHPTPQGYTRLATAIDPVIRRLLGEGERKTAAGF